MDLKLTIHKCSCLGKVVGPVGILKVDPWRTDKEANEDQARKVQTDEQEEAARPFL